MKILVACIHYPVASGRFIARALRRLGHDVKTVGPSTHNQIWAIHVDPKWNWEPDLPGWEWHPDLTIIADSAYAIDRPDWGEYALWGVDNHVHGYAGRDYDYMFFAHSWGARMDEPNAYWLPPCYDPEAHHDTKSERDIDIGIQAVAYAGRVEAVTAMRQAGLNVEAGTGYIWDDYRAFYNRTKVAFVQSSRGDLTLRFFEAMAMGCCVLADHAEDADRMGFVPGEDYVRYADAADAVDKTHELLAGDLWRMIAANGKAKVAPHTWDARAAEMLRIIDEKKQTRDRPG